jgi:DNA-binding FrmR family transcriptional regulator
VLPGRLRRIDQVRVLERMVDEHAHCIDVVTQISAATKVLQAVALELPEDPLGHCGADAIGPAAGRPPGTDITVGRCRVALRDHLSHGEAMGEPR